MIRFTDGPAAGVELILLRAPLLLRVVEQTQLFADGRRCERFDALDQDADEAKPDEVIHVYRRVGEPRGMFLDYRGAGGRRCGTRLIAADYVHVVPQPADHEVRSGGAWDVYFSAHVHGGDI